MYGTIQLGIANWAGYLLAFMAEVWKNLFNVASGQLVWDNASTAGLAGDAAPGVGQIQLGGSMPVLTAKGEDIVAALMTIVHNGLVFVAELSTLLPSNNLTNGY